jgi:hypothetical protein
MTDSANSALSSNSLIFCQNADLQAVGAAFVSEAGTANDSRQFGLSPQAESSAKTECFDEP